MCLTFWGHIILGGTVFFRTLSFPPAGRKSGGFGPAEYGAADAGNRGEPAGLVPLHYGKGAIVRAL